MKKVESSTIEKEMANFKFDELNAHVDKAKTNIEKAVSPADIKAEICKVWSGR
jgi:hypothetical protein